MHPWSSRRAWEGHGVLMLQRPRDAYAVWVFWHGAERAFHGWYINLQEPFRRRREGYDTQDLELDIWIPAGGTWQLKDDELLSLRVQEGRFTQDQARAIREEGARITAELDAGRRWWDTRWAEWSPDDLA
jgi:predicted RNA-binding protein associated with RNAse of E/G family